MVKKFKPLVYSTNSNWEDENDKEDEYEKIAPSSQKLRIRIETKQRGGKKATIISGFIGSDEEIYNLAKSLKTKLGVGGSSKNQEIIIQGSNKEKIKNILVSLGYIDTK